MEKVLVKAGLSLIFAEGERPTADDIESLLAAGPLAGQRAILSQRGDAGSGWVELLASGLALDLSGLAPGDGFAAPPMSHQFGMTVSPGQFRFESILLAPGEHLAGGGAMLPILRAMAAIGLGLAEALPVKAISWIPAESWMEPAYYIRVVGNWLSGGSFPALGFTAIGSTGHGAESSGLGFFAGQEVRVTGAAGEPQGESVQLAARVIDHIIQHGPLTALTELDGPADSKLLAEPTHDGRHVQVWRSLS